MLIREAIVVYKDNNLEIKMPMIQSSKSIWSIRETLIPDGPQERMISIGLNSKLEVVGWSTVAMGTTTFCHVNICDIFRWAIIAGIPNIIICHNHPGGDPYPSQADLLLTSSIIEAGQLLGIGLLDHVIFGKNNYYSFADHNMMK